MGSFLSPPTWNHPVAPIPLGTTGQVLTMVGGVPAFAAAGGGGSGGFAGAEINAAPLAGNNDDFNPGGSPAWPGTLAAPYGILILTDGATPGAATLTGLLAGLARQQVILVNNRATAVTLNNQSVASVAANRFLIGIDLFIDVGVSVGMTYSQTLSRWMVQP